MSEEEMKAVDYWKNYMEILHWNTQLASEHYMKVLLDLIEKQQIELNSLKEIEYKYNKALEDLVKLEKERQADKEKIEELEKQNEELLEVKISANAHNRICKLEQELMEKELMIDGLKEDRRIAAEEIQEQYYISKDKVKIALQDIEDYFDRLNVPDEDIEFIQSIKNELLKEGGE